MVQKAGGREAAGKLYERSVLNKQFDERNWGKILRSSS